VFFVLPMAIRMRICSECLRCLRERCYWQSCWRLG